ncbi:MAG: alpha-amylase [Deltaproteobacteria bacterium]|nr:alpha-amylase [Deltaproteobacteria bacterium]
MEEPLRRRGSPVLPISRRARARFDLEDEEFPRGDATPEDYLHAARRLADRVNSRAELNEGAEDGASEDGALEDGASESGVSAGRLHALVLISRFLGLLLGQYRQQRHSDVLSQAVDWLEERFGAHRLQKTWQALDHFFPSGNESSGSSNSIAEQSGVKGTSSIGAGEPGRSRAEEGLEALLVIWALNDNPAVGPWQQLFDDGELEETSGYRDLFVSLREFFSHQPGFGPDDENLLDLVRAPARVAPDSLRGQLRFISRVSPDLLVSELSVSGLSEMEFRDRTLAGPESSGSSWSREVLVGLDVLREEDKPVFVGPGGAPGPGPPEVLDFAGMDEEEERFSEDRRWMPELVLVAKNVFVWLDQISSNYGRPVHRLDQIPDRELDRLARWGMSGLWLIGLWQRSDASRRIKRLCGNPEAAASAYSLENYRIAEELGGEKALEDLTRRASRRGIRLACDMVPNHFGIDSQWVMDHPERFLSLPHPPFPGYRFQGPDLSSNPEVELFLEDGYYNRQDAAVVFLRRDRQTGQERFIYHGNDGTGLPWNDTAQLDYLRQETREAVIEAIVSVAKRFPIIRFDAAMTLARRHVQRLWYPEPGKGGDIPSRAAHGIREADFRRLMPKEFWREVVDRLAREAPDTLLLAEAFWLMEGFFVRTLGMHRVYHSAFMHMLRDEDNAGFRQTLRNTLEFNPEILKRFVNYLTTPDEASAARQFGTGDKYFGTCALMVTLPGLPLFGHGQVEGLAEKYGMEYRRAYSREEPVEALVERHQRQIGPLLERRRLFAGAEQFRLYDFQGSQGRVDENVLAFSNGLNLAEGKRERVLVVFHNHPGRTQGRLQVSVPWRPTGDGAEGSGGGASPLRQQTLAAALGWNPEGGEVIRFRDLLSGLEFLVETEADQPVSLELRLGPYECRVLTDFEILPAEASQGAQVLVDFLGNEGVPSLQEALEDLHQLPARDAVQEFLEPSWLSSLEGGFSLGEGPRESLLERFEAHSVLSLQALEPWVEGSAETPLGGKSAGRAGDTAGAKTESLARPLLLAGQTHQLLTRILGLSAAAGAGPSGRSYEAKLGRWVLTKLGEDLKGVGPGVVSEGESAPIAAPGSQDEAAEGEASDRELAGGKKAEGLSRRGGLLIWVCLRNLGSLKSSARSVHRSRALFDAWGLNPVVERSLRRLGLTAPQAARAGAAVRLFMGQRQEWWKGLGERPMEALVAAWIRDPEVRRFLDVNTFEGVQWFHREAFEELLWWTGAAAWVAGTRGSLTLGWKVVAALDGAAELASYRVDRLLEAVSKAEIGAEARSAGSKAGVAEGLGARDRQEGLQ